MTQMKNTFQFKKMILTTAIFCFCIQPSFAQPGVSPYYKAPDSYAGKTFVVPAGTTFEGLIESTIGSTVSKQGTPFIITISSPVLANGSDVLIPAGATVLGEVIQAIPAHAVPVTKVPHQKKEKPVGKLRVQINALKMPDGMTYPMVASLVGEQAVGNPYNMNQFGKNNNPVRGSGVAYVGSPTGFQSVAPGTAHFNTRTGVSQVVTKNEMLHDPIMGRQGDMNERTAIRSLVKKDRNLFIYKGSPLTIRLEAPFKVGIGSSAGEESALRMHSSELGRPTNNNAPDNQSQVQSPPQTQTENPAAQTPYRSNGQNSFIPRTQQQTNNQDSNF
jgi:hypothetical protein